MKSRSLFTLIMDLVLVFAVGCGSSTEASIIPPLTSNLIIFSSYRDAEDSLISLYSVDPRSGAIERLTYRFNAATYGTWSPDRQKIAFSSQDDGHSRVYVMDADGSNIEMVTDFSSSNADWFPSGERLIFSSDSRAEPVDTPDLYAMNLDGSDLVEIIDRNETGDLDGHVSPDGSRIVFVSLSYRANGVTVTGDIFVADIDGSNLIQVTNDALGSYAPDWAPDGDRILFTGNLNGNWDLFVINADGSGLVQLTDLPGSELSGDWSPDGEQIVFISEQGKGLVLTVMEADGSNMVPLVDDGFFVMVPSW